MLDRLCIVRRSAFRRLASSGAHDEIAADGGGTLTLTAGVYRTGAIFFKPGVNLHLEKGATILGVDEAEGYPQQETRIEGETCLYYPALINADRCDGFTISGEGVIDGHGANTWEEFWTKLAEARKKGGDFRNKALMRPRVLYVSRSKNVDVSGVTFKNSKFWTTHYYDCEDVVVHDCKIVAETLKDSKGRNLKGPSTDAIDIDKCRRFTVRNVDIAVNDDGVVVKGGKGAWANDYGKFPGNGPSTDVLVENCRGVCKTFLRIRGWTQYHDAQGRSAADLMSYADGVTLRGNSIEAKVVGNVKPAPDVFAVSNLALDGNVIYQLAPNLPLKQDGYVVEKTRTGYVVKARERSAFLCANSESNRWMNASSYPFCQDTRPTER